MAKNLSKTLILLVAAVIIFSVGYWRFFSAPLLLGDNSVLFQVEAEQNLRNISGQLESKKLIRSNRVFNLYADLKNLDTKIQPGRYHLNQNMNAKKILLELTDPVRKEIAVTIPEGFSVRQIDEKLFNTGLILPGEFASKAEISEGYLFPDTYFVYDRNFNPEDLIKKMQDNFLKKITPDFLEAAEKQNRTLQEVVTMASILEKEVRTEQDYAVVAGILWKRLDSSWPLQTDATLLYGKSKTTISQSDLSENSPYNTRKFKGLPPTPIGNPGIETIRAAVFPKSSSYWFYLTDEEGNVHYAKTNEEHNANRRKYLDL